MNIKQMTLTTGYVAVYEDEDGEELVEPVIGLAVVGDEDGDRIMPFTIDDDGVSFPEECENFSFFAKVVGEQ
jgi:hypothetical protein